MTGLADSTLMLALSPLISLLVSIRVEQISVFTHIQVFFVV